jgi:hypothetical protein
MCANFQWHANSRILARGYDVSVESPKSDQLALFKHGERAYDHLLILPPKSKGEQFQLNWSDDKSID